MNANNNFKKSCTVPKNTERGDPSASSAFANARKSFLTKAGTRTRDRWVPCKATKVCTKKWYIQCEVCGLTKKKRNKLVTVTVGHFSIEKRRLKMSHVIGKSKDYCEKLQRRNVFV